LHQKESERRNNIAEKDLSFSAQKREASPLFSSLLFSSGEGSGA
jgi:hypothetical protein